MSRYIDADKLAKEILRAWELWDKKGEDCFIFSDIITPMLVGQPTADVRENVHGEWITHKNVEIVHDLFITNYECSICKTWNRYNSNYCPNCGSYNGGDNNVHE